MNLRPENPVKTYSQDDSLIFLLRHGQICGAEKKRFIGTTDVSLDDAGLLQARYWETVFSDLPPDIIYSSSLQRCDHTARQIAGKRPIINTHALNEIHMGEWDGKTFEEIKMHYPEEFIKRGESLSIAHPMVKVFRISQTGPLPFLIKPLSIKKEKY